MKTLIKLKSFLAGATFFLLTALVIPLHLPAQSEIKGDATEDVKQKVRELNKQLEEAFRSGDMVKAVDFYADDAIVIIPGGKKIQGRKAIYEYLGSLKETKDFRLEVTDVNGSGKVLYQLGTVTFSAETNGMLQTHSTDHVKVWKRGSDWDYKISVDSFN